MKDKDINNLKEMLIDFNEYSTDYTKTRCRELDRLLEEIERLNNIIEKLDDYVIANQMFEFGNTREEAEQYLQELKGSE